MDDSDSRLNEICRLRLNALMKHFGGNLETIAILRSWNEFKQTFPVVMTVLWTKCSPDFSPSCTQIDLQLLQSLCNFVMKNKIIDVGVRRQNTWMFDVSEFYLLFYLFIFSVLLMMPLHNTSNLKALDKERQMTVKSLLHWYFKV